MVPHFDMWNCFCCFACSPSSGSWASLWRVESSTVSVGRASPMPQCPSTTRSKVTSVEEMYCCIEATQFRHRLLSLFTHFHTEAHLDILSSQSSARRTVLSGWRTWRPAPTPSASTRSSCSSSQSQWRSLPTHPNSLTSSQPGSSGPSCFFVDSASVPSAWLLILPHLRLALSNF